MQPLINLKQFLAVLLILIVPAALLTAYFRNYQPETGGSGHQHADAAGTHPAGGHGDMAMPAGEAAGHEHGATSSDDHGEMDHGKPNDGAAQQGAAPAPDAKQLEASRAQLEASRAQLEASRQALEATKTQPAPQESQPPAPSGKPAEPTAPAESGKKPDAPKQGGAADGHTHQH